METISCGHEMEAAPKPLPFCKLCILLLGLLSPLGRGEHGWILDNAKRRFIASSNSCICGNGTACHACCPAEHHQTPVELIALSLSNAEVLGSWCGGLKHQEGHYN